MTARDRPEARERWQVVHDSLRSMILTGELQSAERIGEVQLAERFGVSRGPIREALHQLEVEGLVIRHQRLGSYVASLGGRDIEEIYALRGALEELAVREAMASNYIPLRYGLGQAFEELAVAVRTGRMAELPRADLQFHSVFYQSAGNGRLLAAWNGLRHPLQVLVGMSGGPSQVEWTTTLERHAPILHAVEAGDVEACVAEVRKHVASARDLVAAEVAAARQAGEVVA